MQDSGYATGLFGKWHLGDNCPLRPSDKGFEKSVRHLDGQFSRPWNKSEYFDPIVFENDIEKGRLIMFSAIDNLIKGGSGNAVQNMNIMFGIDEKAGLLSPSLHP